MRRPLQEGRGTQSGMQGNEVSGYRPCTWPLPALILATTCASLVGMQAGAAAPATARTSDDDENGMIDNTLMITGVAHGFSQQVRACMCSRWSLLPTWPGQGPAAMGENRHQEWCE